MSLTLGNYIYIAIIFVIAVLVSLAVAFDYRFSLKQLIIGLSITIVITLVNMFALNWYNTRTANGQRNFKSYKSNIEGGIERTIDVYSQDGTNVYHYQGKIDVEDEKQAYCIWFESEEGTRTIIHYAVTDRVFIQEVKE